MSKLAVLISGGDAPGMNVAIEAVVKVAASRRVSVVGVQQGYEGLIDGKSVELARHLDDGSDGEDPGVLSL